MLEDYSKIQPEVLKDIDARVTQVLRDMQKDQQYSLSKIQAHAHTGIDSLQVNPIDLINFSSYAALQTTVLTAAQIKTLHTTPVTLVSIDSIPSIANLPGAVIIVEGITAKIYYGGTAYTGANNLEFRYGTSSGTKVTADMSTTFLNQSATVFAHVAGVTTEIITANGFPIIVCVPTANPATGNSNIAFTVKYRIVTL